MFRRLLRGMRRTAVFCIVVIAGFRLIGIPSFWVFDTNFYRNALPEKIQVEGFVDAASDGVLLAREACGAVIYRLTHETIDAINSQGLSFFADARQGRGYPVTHRKGPYYSYSPWKETPLDNEEGNTLLYLGLGCKAENQDNHQPALHELILDAASKEGAYFSMKQEAVVVVLPSLGVVILAYIG